MPNIFLLLFLLFALVSCSTNRISDQFFSASDFVIDSYKIKEGKLAILELEGKQCAPVDKALLEDGEESICEGDTLAITLYHPEREDLSSVFAQVARECGFVVCEGEIQLPILGSVAVEGLTLPELQKKVQRLFDQQFEDCEIFVSYAKRANRYVELAGLVATSTIPITPTTKLYDVLAQAKIPHDANLFKSYLIRDSEMICVDFHKLLKEGDMSQNIRMENGDKIYIAESSAASMMVMGEVGVERVIDLPSGSISLRKALAEARGIPFTGDKSFIQVIRGNIASPKVYLLSWEHVLRLPNDSLLLMPGDIVYVAAKPITEWNRFISQILPTSMGIEVFQKSFNNIGVILP